VSDRVAGWWRPLAVLLIPAGMLMPATASCASSPGPARPNILLITIESLRADRLGCYGGEGAATPAIDALAGRGLRFERAYTASPSTAPSVATVLTGLYPARHSLRDDLGGRLADGVRTVASILRDAGYRTGAVVGSFHLDPDRGLDRGFDSYDADIPGLVKMVAGRSKERRAGDVVEAGLRFIDAHRGPQPFFLWLDLYDPHADYDPPEPFKTRFAADPYRGEVAYVDDRIGALVAGLRSRGLEDVTAIVLAGSHGEGLGDHGETGHGIYLFETTIRVPLILVPTGGAPPRLVPEPVGLVDLAPTLYEIARVEIPTSLDGHALTAWRGAARREASTGTPAPRRYYVEAVQPWAAYGWHPLFAVIEGNRKVVQGRRLQAFDLDAGPGETDELVPSPSWAPDMVSFGDRLIGRLEPSPAVEARAAAAIRRLALPWSGSPICREREALPDPRDLLRLNDPLFRARLDFDQGIVGRAAKIAEETVLPADPVNYSGLFFTLFLAVRTGRHDLVRLDLELMQCNYPLRGTAYHFWAHELELQGGKETAQEQALQLFGLLEPWSEEPFYDLAVLHARQGKKEAALQDLEKSIGLGARDLDYIRRDGRLKILHDDPRFKQLVGPAAPAATPRRP
jgi:arylsulfatase A-like enzyme